ncbi:MAG: hypothetical protein N2111_14205 [Candidatus Sumerlaeaceae bacterium]|nr:hypothetical protein [Candidatus Sumerlaeaceae bacterium]
MKRSKALMDLFQRNRFCWIVRKQSIFDTKVKHTLVVSQRVYDKPNDTSASNITDFGLATRQEHSRANGVAKSVRVGRGRQNSRPVRPNLYGVPLKDAFGRIGDSFGKLAHRRRLSRFQAGGCRQASRRLYRLVARVNLGVFAGNGRLHVGLLRH